MFKQIIGFFEKNKKVSFAGMLISLGIMSYFSGIPGSKVHFGSVWPSIIYHLGIFATFSFFVLAFVAKRNPGKKDYILWAIIIIATAILDELHQTFVPLRDAGIFDFIIDTLGATITASCCTIIKLVNKIKINKTG